MVRDDPFLCWVYFSISPASILQGSWGAEHRFPSIGKGTWKDFCRRVGWTITPGQEKPEHIVTCNQKKKKKNLPQDTKCDRIKQK